MEARLGRVQTWIGSFGKGEYKKSDVFLKTTKLIRTE